MNPAYFDRLAQVESGGNPNAKNPKSSASGLFQFTSATAKQYNLEDPTDPVQAREAVERFTADNAAHLQKVLGRTPSDGELYLAHQQGAGGATKLLSNPDRPAIEVVGVDAVVNNGGDKNMTAKEFSDMWIAKFGVTNASVTVDSGPQENKPSGQTVVLPDGKKLRLTGQEDAATLAKIKQKIIEKYRFSVDRRSGAPVSVRAIVGSVRDPQDKLATLQKTYPDAIPYGEDNFVFVSPETKKLTLYNPRGLDFGDLASVAREGTQIAGGTAGAVAGAATGLAVSVPTAFTAAPVSVPTGAIAGSGLGFASGGAAFDALLNSFGLTQDSRTNQEKVGEFAIDTAVGAVGEGVGIAVAAGAKAAAGAVGKAVSGRAKRLVGGGSPAAKALVERFRSFGVEPSAGLVINKGFAILEAGFQQNPVTADLLLKQADNIVVATQRAVNKIIDSIGTSKTAQGAGETIKQAAINAAERFGFREEKLYQKAFDLIGDTTPVKPKAALSLLKEMELEALRAPQTLGKTLDPAIKFLRGLFSDSIKRTSDGRFVQSGIEFSALRRIRTAVGRDLDAPLLTGSTGSQNEAMKRVYAALTDDLSEVARLAGPEAEKALATADRFKRIWSNTAADTMNKIAKFDADERAFKFAMNAAQDGGSNLARLRRHFKPEEWDTVAASVLDKLGDASAGAQNAAGDRFSINTFLSNWNRLAPEAKRALFGGKRYQAQREALDNLTVLMERVKDAQRFNNTSNTGGALTVNLLLSALGTTGGLAVSGDFPGVIIGVTLAFTPRMAAKLITSPRFVSWLSEPLEQAAKSGAKKISVAQHIAALSVIAKEEPAIEAEIKAYINTLSQITKE